MSTKEIKELASNCLTAQYPNGWAVWGFDEQPLLDSGFEVTNSRPDGYDEWDRAYFGYDHWILLRWYNSQTGGLEYYYKILKVQN